MCHPKNAVDASYEREREERGTESPEGGNKRQILDREGVCVDWIACL